MLLCRLIALPSTPIRDTTFTPRFHASPQGNGRTMEPKSSKPTTTHTHAQTRSHAHTHTHTHAHTHALSHTHRLTHAHARARTHTPKAGRHIHIHAHAASDTPALALLVHEEPDRAGDGDDDDDDGDGWVAPTTRWRSKPTSYNRRVVQTLPAAEGAQYSDRSYRFTQLTHTPYPRRS